MHKSRKKYILLVFFALLLSCQRYESLDFTSNMVDYSWGSIGTKLHGTIDDSRIFLAEMGPPYDLFVWFAVNENTQKIIISKIILKDKKTKKNLFKESDVINFRDINEQKSRIYFVFKKLNIEHEDILLEIDFSIHSEKSIIEDSAHIELHRFHSVKYQLIGV